MVIEELCDFEDPAKRILAIETRNFKFHVWSGVEMGAGDGGGFGDGGVEVRVARRSRTKSSLRLRSTLAWLSV